MRRNRFIPISILPCVLLTTGCLRTHNIVIKTPPNTVLNATTSQLVDKVNAQYDMINTLTATVDMSASVGNNTTGEATDYPASRGYIVIGKPEMLRVIGQVPVIRTTAFDMVSDGKVFTLYIPPRSKAITGGMKVETPSKNALENLRPEMFLDSLLIRSIGPDEMVSRTDTTHILETNLKARHVLEQLDYDLWTYRLKQDSNQLIPLRVIHISRTTLQPYELDIFDDEGKVVTETHYDLYQQFGTLTFPSQIIIERPQDNLTLTLNIIALHVNQTFEDNQFKLEIPAGTAVEKLQ
jgi:outer membrane lipoprotein-sorting protein